MYQTDCYFYSEVREMNGRIPCCGKKNLPDCYEPKDCDRVKCKYYISESQVNKIVNEIVGE